MQIYGITNYQGYYKIPQNKGITVTTQKITFSGVEDRFEKLKKQKEDEYSKEKRSTTNINNLFRGNNISETELNFLEDYLREEQRIIEEYDQKIANVKDGFWDNWFSSAEDKRAKLRKEKEEALKVAHRYQRFFEEREKDTIKLKMKYREVAESLNFSKEVLAAFDASQQASEKRLEIIKRREQLAGKIGLSQLAGYREEKDILQSIFIDPLDDEKAGKIPNKQIPNALLFYGPTGCGKTTFAKALAEETLCNFEILKIKGATQKQREKFLIDSLKGKSSINIFSNKQENLGLLDKAQQKFLDTNVRTIILIDEFDRFFSKDTSNEFLRELKGILEECSEDYHTTLFLATNNPQKIPYELLSPHRVGLKVNLDPPSKSNSIAVIEHYIGNCDTTGIDYNKIIEMLFKYAPDEVYSNTHLKSICEIATDQLKPANDPLTTEMILNAIEIFENSEENHDLIRITKKHLDQYEEDKKNI
jgi:SpoVK/Ycf46/Vps4 family AAA+-type ATPase